MVEMGILGLFSDLCNDKPKSPLCKQSHVDPFLIRVLSVTSRSLSPALRGNSCSSWKDCSEIPSLYSPSRGRIDHQPITWTGVIGKQRNALCPFLTGTPTSSRPPEREIICVSLKKDPKIGLGKWIMDHY